MTTRPQPGLLRLAALLPAATAVLGLTGCAATDQSLSSAQPAAPSAQVALPSGQSALPSAHSSAQLATSSASPGSISVTGATPAAQPGVADSECSQGAGFAVSLVSGYSGWATPVEAARQFSLQSDPEGYGTPSTTWTLGAADSSGVSLTGSHVTLHALRLPSGRWAIDSGQRCD